MSLNLPSLNADRILTTNRIALIGPQGCGKSAIAKELKFLFEKSGNNFKLVESDLELEKRIGMKIPMAFEKHGADYVRRIEGDIIEEISTQKNIILSTGGGAVYPTGGNITQNEIEYNYNRNKSSLKNFYTVYPIPSESLDESLKICNWRISGAEDSSHRIPLPQETLEIRHPHYKKASDLVVYSKYGLPTNLAKSVLREYCKNI
jgi:shikimate kinase